MSVGILAAGNLGRILRCNVEGYVQGAEAGGFVGANYGSIVNCSANVTVVGIKTDNMQMYPSGLGGFVGFNRSGTIENCFVRGKLGVSEKIENAGGFVGCHSDVASTASVFPEDTERPSLKNCYSSVEFFGDYGDSNEDEAVNSFPTTFAERQVRFLNRGTFAGYIESDVSETEILYAENCFYNDDIVSDILPSVDSGWWFAEVEFRRAKDMKKEGFVRLLNQGDANGPWLFDAEMQNEGFPVLDENFAVNEDELYYIKD
jgi:hypothetical protein